MKETKSVEHVSVAEAAAHGAMETDEHVDKEQQTRTTTVGQAVSQTLIGEVSQEVKMSKKLENENLKEEGNLKENESNDKFSGMPTESPSSEHTNLNDAEKEPTTSRARTAAGEISTSSGGINALQESEAVVATTDLRNEGHIQEAYKNLSSLGAEAAAATTNPSALEKVADIAESTSRQKPDEAACLVMSVDAPTPLVEIQSVDVIPPVGTNESNTALKGSSTRTATKKATSTYLTGLAMLSQYSSDSDADSDDTETASDGNVEIIDSSDVDSVIENPLSGTEGSDSSAVEVDTTNDPLAPKLDISVVHEVDYGKDDVVGAVKTYRRSEYRSKVILSSTESSDSSADEEDSTIDGLEAMRKIIDISCKFETDSTDEDDVIGDVKTPRKHCPPKVKGEQLLEDLPPIEDLHITVPEEQCEELGHIESIVHTLVTVAALPLSLVVDLDSVLFLDKGKRVLGVVFDVIGQVACPLYVVRFNTTEEIKEKGVNVGDKVYVAPKTEYTKYVIISNLTKNRGSDASWEHDIEPPTRCLDYSDDEEERAARAKHRGRDRQNENEDGDETKRTRTADADEPSTSTAATAAARKPRTFFGTPHRQASSSNYYPQRQLRTPRSAAADFRMQFNGNSWHSNYYQRPPPPYPQPMVGPPNYTNNRYQVLPQPPMPGRTFHTPPPPSHLIPQYQMSQYQMPQCQMPAMRPPPSYPIVPHPPMPGNASPLVPPPLPPINFNVPPPQAMPQSWGNAPSAAQATPPPPLPPTSAFLPPQMPAISTTEPPPPPPGTNGTHDTY